jgi:hypothetical protein
MERAPKFHQGHLQCILDFERLSCLSELVVRRDTGADISTDLVDIGEILVMTGGTKRIQEQGRARGRQHLGAIEVCLQFPIWATV